MSNGTKFPPRMAGKTSIRQDQPSVIGERKARGLNDFPNVAIGIGEIAAIAAVVGFLRTP
jgi:hypothetical protein